MMSIEHFDLRRFDLNLLLAFDAMVQERSVTRAAARLRLQQPAMSYALATLRRQLNDELFVRTPAGMAPTPRAAALAGPIRAILGQVQATVLPGRAPFDPQLAAGRIVVGMSDQLEATLLPACILRLQREAPLLKLAARPAPRGRVHAILGAGEVDLALGYFPQGPAWCRHEVLFEEGHLCLRNPSLLPPPDTLDVFLAAGHVMVSSDAEPEGYMAAALARVAVHPRVVMTTPNFLTVAHVVLRAPLLATLPARIARHCAATMPLAATPPPFTLEPFPIALLWRQQDDADPLGDWIRGILRQVAASSTS